MFEAIYAISKTAVQVALMAELRFRYEKIEFEHKAGRTKSLYWMATSTVKADRERYMSILDKSKEMNHNPLYREKP